MFKLALQEDPYKKPQIVGNNRKFFKKLHKNLSM